MKKTTFAIDFDGTLATYDGWKGALHLGEPHKGAVEFVNKALEMGHEVILHTCRTTIVTPEGSVDRDHFVSQEEMVSVLQKWMKSYGIRDGVQIWTEPGKPHCDAYIDDKGVSVRPKFDKKAWANMTKRFLED